MGEAEALMGTLHLNQLGSQAHRATVIEAAETAGAIRIRRSGSRRRRRHVTGAVRMDMGTARATAAAVSLP